ncbi:hypothetical protein pb186bvf_002680 [Paramecium bursaria]
MFIYIPQILLYKSQFKFILDLLNLLRQNRCCIILQITICTSIQFSNQLHLGQSDRRKTKQFEVIILNTIRIINDCSVLLINVLLKQISQWFINSWSNLKFNDFLRFPFWHLKKMYL